MQPITLAVSGISLSATLFLPDKATLPPPWPAVLVFHGFAGSKESHAEFGEFLAARGFAALTLDQRGHGGSGGLMDANILEDVGAAFDSLASLPGVDPRRIAVRGSSMGGNIAIHAAVRFPAIAAAGAVCPATRNRPPERGRPSERSSTFFFRPGPTTRFAGRGCPSTSLPSSPPSARCEA